MQSHTEQATRAVKVWDISIRLFHWSLVGLIGFLWWSGTEGVQMDNHVLAGYTVLGLVVYRVIWGFIGSYHARFINFIRSPIKTLKSIPEVLSVRSNSHHVGHNPVGGWMVVALVLILLAQGISGLGTTDDIFIDGPLVPYISDDMIYWLTDLHLTLPDYLIALVVLHLAAVLFHDTFKREHLIQAMITGVKKVPASLADSVRQSELPAKRFLIVVALLSGMGWWLISNFG
ncbi:cytochrome b/b6 domain-containing protein [Oceanospirillum linum]|uniref:Cytochrome b561 bacterial/Ni-hydrogenase domain-containing protein n=1 Tax=Oceanospirillum linum TaxID=966 RepID=A0A1T1H7V0_OCELI|nr:cytochrome b/b6 domain-containing protein [Oceanospirillum linum]OOV85941.1 hypothetical protein BTA35_0215630 [Oceanospirillum linum]SEG45496.1 Cytochrome b [Oleiphilus messinensis]SMP34617.1 Cytochrome b [Oceanospirillum linum]